MAFKFGDRVRYDAEYARENGIVSSTDGVVVRVADDDGEVIVAWENGDSVAVIDCNLEAAPKASAVTTSPYGFAATLATFHGTSFGSGPVHVHFEFAAEIKPENIKFLPHVGQRVSLSLYPINSV